jgi:hypothetical protein
MWRYYDWLNPQCGATYDAESPCGVIMSVEMLRGLRYSLAEVNTLSITMPFQTYSQYTRYVIHIFCIFRIHTKYSLCKRIREFILDADNIDGKDDC